MKKKLYLMRHGKTALNEQKLNQGWWDGPLTKEGIEGAILAGQALRSLGIEFDKAYSSTSERACDTLELVTEGNMPYTRLKGLKELNFGLLEGKPSFLNPPLPFEDQLKAYGGESVQELVERLNTTLNEIMMDEEAETVLVSSHGAACANFMKQWLAASKVQSYRSPIPNCTIFVYEFGPEDQSYDLVDILYPDTQKEIVEKGRREPESPEYYQSC